MAERLIDAEALKTRIQKIEAEALEHGFAPEYVCVDLFLDFLDNAPTAEAKPIVYAHWTKFWNTFYMQNMYCCSKCGNNALTREETMFDQVLTKFCPYCGAQMDEKESD